MIGFYAMAMTVVFRSAIVVGAAPGVDRTSPQSARDQYPGCA
ncbi:hypothetical protein RSPO_c00182 [Ralstonia solanacearum Po82]|uniref:Uncharacterized protein n=1 Tax=Ralstonia solanacearum (strain Po82) TaxID=1031711 RepID=F6G6E1_RALS8|nr:hypothetical protein RSPO_c00182 [Ralstonia solanacearum Po82]